MYSLYKNQGAFCHNNCTNPDRGRWKDKGERKEEQKESRKGLKGEEENRRREEKKGERKPEKIKISKAIAGQEKRLKLLCRILNFFHSCCI